MYSDVVYKGIVGCIAVNRCIMYYFVLLGCKVLKEINND